MDLEYESWVSQRYRDLEGNWQKVTVYFKARRDDPGPYIVHIPIPRSLSLWPIPRAPIEHPPVVITVTLIKDILPEFEIVPQALVGPPPQLSIAAQRHLGLLKPPSELEVHDEAVLDCNEPQQSTASPKALSLVKPPCRLKVKLGAMNIDDFAAINQSALSGSMPEQLICPFCVSTIAAAQIHSTELAQEQNFFSNVADFCRHVLRDDRHPWVDNHDRLRVVARTMQKSKLLCKHLADEFNATGTCEAKRATGRGFLREDDVLADMQCMEELEVPRWLIFIVKKSLVE